MLDRAQTYQLERVDPSMQFQSRVQQFTAVPLAVVFLVLYFTGIVAAFVLIFVVPAVLGSLIIPPVVLARVKQGKVDISSAGMRVHKPAFTIDIPWSDIGSIELRSQGAASARGLYSLLGIDLRGSFVHVQLLRKLKGNLSKTEFGTSRSGIPVVGQELSLFVLDGERFVREAEEYRAQSSSSA